MHNGSVVQHSPVGQRRFQSYTAALQPGAEEVKAAKLALGSGSQWQRLKYHVIPGVPRRHAEREVLTRVHSKGEESVVRTSLPNYTFTNPSNRR
jgi:hypothetical protein